MTMVEDEKEEEIYKKFGFSSIECLMLKSAINTMLAIRIQIVGFMKVVERLKTYEERIGEEGAEQQDEHGELFSAHMDTQQTQHENYDDSKGRGRGGCSNWRGRGPRRSGYYYVTTLHGGKSQEQSEINLEGFRAKKYNILVTTDTVGRGIDVLDVAHVINYDILKHMERYTHRIGRTRRAEKNFDAKLHSIGELDKTNRKAALSIFYSLALAEALMFLAEKAYWEWQVSVCSLLENVTKQCGFGVIGMVSIKRFFFDAFSKSVNGSNYDGDNVDMVSFVMELLGSSCPYEQLIGARILRKCAEDKIEKIGINLPVIERLVEMRNWKDVKEEEIRRSAAEILSKLAGMTQYSLRVAGITGAMESISSLLQNTRSLGEAPDEIGEKNIFHDHHLLYDYCRFNNLGLLILKKLSRDHDNYGKIGNIRGLLQKIIDFMHTDAILLKDENVEMVLSRFLTVKRSLQLVRMLVSMSKNTGRCLRREISEIVFTVSNLRDVLHHGVRYPKLQKLKIEILSFLALEREARERIGVTGGVMKELFNIFLKSKARRDVNERKVKIAAGEAIAMLDLESRSNCVHILKLGVLARLVDAFEVPLVRVNAARVLRNLCLYSEHECFIELRLIKAAAPMVLKSITSGDNKLQEVMLGLATQVFKFMSSEEVHDPLMDSGIKKKELAYLFVSTLKKHDKPSVKVPKIRFVVELARWMMEGDVENVVMFRDLAIKREQELLGAKDKIDTKESELIQMILAKREDEIKNKREDLAGEKEENLQDAERKALSEKKKLNRSKWKAKHRLHRKEKKSSKDRAGNIAANAVASNETQKSDTVTTPTVPDVFNSLQIKLWEYQVKKKAGQVTVGYADRSIRIRGTEKGTCKTTLGGVDTNGDYFFACCEIQRQTKDIVVGVWYSNSGSLLTCQQAGKTIVFFRVLSRDIQKSKESLETVIKLHATSEIPIVGERNSGHRVDPEDGKSVEGNIFYVDESLIMRCSIEQETVVLSSGEATLITENEAAKLATWRGELQRRILRREQRTDILWRALGKLKFKEMRGVEDFSKMEFKLKGENVGLSLKEKVNLRNKLTSNPTELWFKGLENIRINYPNEFRIKKKEICVF
ncbi:uncharacterized protein LOC117128572 [Brassica rapa]|uniref:uncharacterized protein LOC117128572 n=1 Tax=Brassica campestris TaxID=3711 RepID=UPI00142DA157|nr:uncharacterized protein LOC117128572 [Brassica rapa]